MIYFLLLYRCFLVIIDFKTILILNHQFKFFIIKFAKKVFKLLYFIFHFIFLIMEFVFLFLNLLKYLKILKNIIHGVKIKTQALHIINLFKVISFDYGYPFILFSLKENFF